MPIAERLAEIRQNIGRQPVTLVAATKYASTDQMREAYEAGIRHFGENRLQDALEKIPRFPQAEYPDLHWHFIGHLQSNKVSKTMGLFTAIHSVDSVRLAEVISTYNTAAGRIQPILLQLNLSGESTKTGFSQQEALPALRKMLNLPGISVKGLMTMAPHTPESDTLKAIFRELRDTRNRLSEACEIDLPELSMGMSHDYIHAVECGATIIRIGNFLFS